MNARALLTIPTLLLALEAHGSCLAPRPGPAPAVPDGSEATEAAMLASQAATRAYVAAVERYLDCRREDLHPLTYNLLVQRAKQAAATYNGELREFRASQETIAGR